MAELRHKNYTELAVFCRDWNDDLRESTGKIKDAYKMLSPTLTTALRQFIMEVVDYGVGISGMTAREWFNDEGVRRPYADAIAAVYNAYQLAEEGPMMADANPIEAELNMLKDMVAKLAADVAALATANKSADSESPAEVAPEPETKADSESEESEEEKPAEEE